MRVMRKTKNLSLHDCWEVLSEYTAHVNYDRPISGALKKSVCAAMSYLATYSNHAKYGHYESLKRLDEMGKEADHED